MTIDEKKEYIKRKTYEGLVQRRKSITQYLKDGGVKAFDCKTIQREVSKEPIIVIDGKETD